jgi:hypothetical protein
MIAQKKFETFHDLLCGTKRYLQFTTILRAKLNYSARRTKGTSALPSPTIEGEDSDDASEKI